MPSDSKYSLKFAEGNEKGLLYRNTYFFSSFILGYILFATWIGPSFMRTRKPFNFQKILVTYNLIEIFLNGYITYWIISEAIVYKHLHCLPLDHHSFPAAMEKIMPLCKLVFFNKTLELLDTVFFVLRKKFNQITFLHVSHHSLVCFLAWWGLRNAPHVGGYYLAIPLAINAGVHTVMYTYYCLAAMGPRIAKILWWKKYVTVLQMVQFVVILSYMLIETLNGCIEINKMEAAIVLLISSMLYLFLNFYKKYKQS